MSAIAIGRRLSAFLERGNSIVVATRNAALEPSATRGTGLRVLDGDRGDAGGAPPRDRIAVLLPRATSARTIANLEANGEIAVCVSWPRDFRTYQLKGRCLAIAASTPDDVLLCEQQLQSFAEAVALFGNTRAQARNLWLFDTWRVDVRVTALFAQSPGPGAGARMGAADVE